MIRDNSEIRSECDRPALSVKYMDLFHVYEVDKSPKMFIAQILGGLYYIMNGVHWADWKFSIKLSEHVQA
jgi:hypothetical protein